MAGLRRVIRASGNGEQASGEDAGAQFIEVAVIPNYPQEFWVVCTFDLVAGQGCISSGCLAKHFAQGYHARFGDGSLPDPDAFGFSKLVTCPY